MIDKLIEQIIEKKSPICVGLDTKFDYIPQEFLSHEFSTDALTYAANNIFQYNCALVDAIADIVPAVKVQAAYYEMYGCEGVKAFRDGVFERIHRQDEDWGRGACGIQCGFCDGERLSWNGWDRSVCGRLQKI